MAGLEDALAYSKGDTSRGKARMPTPQIGDVDIVKLRDELHMSQEQFAAAICVKPATLRNWEQRRRQPEGPARVLLSLLEKDPQGQIELLWRKKGPKSKARRLVRDSGRDGGEAR
jgi:putative transcriptional regulator